MDYKCSDITNKRGVDGNVTYLFQKNEKNIRLS